MSMEGVLVLLLLLLVFNFGNIKKRLHNSGKSGWWLLLVIPEIIILYYICLIEYKITETLIDSGIAFVISFISFILLFSFIPCLLVFLPESKEPNQYGLPRGSLNIDPNDKILGFLVNKLIKSNSISPEQEIKKIEGENE